MIGLQAVNPLPLSDVIVHSNVDVFYFTKDMKEIHE
jgi:hypothetical protein